MYLTINVQLLAKTTSQTFQLSDQFLIMPLDCSWPRITPIELYAHLTTGWHDAVSVSRNQLYLLVDDLQIFVC